MLRSRPKKRSSLTGGDLDAQLTEWRKQGLRVGFTNGCFDILHPGHVKVLTAARGACDRLIVGLNSDASVKRLKGEERPVQDERARAEVLAALEAVDLVVIFEEDTPIKLIAQSQAERAGQGRRLHPRAGRRPRDRRSAGGEVLLIDILPGFSTTSLVNRARGASVSAAAVRRRRLHARRISFQRSPAIPNTVTGANDRFQSDLRNVLIATHDALATALALFVELLSALRGRQRFFDRLPLLLRILPYFVVFSVVVCYVFNLTTTKWRFISLPDALNIVRVGHGADAGAAGARLHLRRAEHLRHASSSARSPSCSTGFSRCSS